MKLSLLLNVIDPAIGGVMIMGHRGTGKSTAVRALAELMPSEGSLANPIDMLGSAVGSTYEEAIPHVLADPGIDALIVLFVPPVVAGAEEVAEAVVRGVRAAPAQEKPVLAAFISAGGVPASPPSHPSVRRGEGVAARRRGGRSSERSLP